MLTLYHRTLLSPLRIATPCCFFSDIQNLQLHADFTLVAFSTIVSMILIQVSPKLYEVLQVEGAAESDSSLWMAKIGVLIVSWLVCGLIRRKPLLRYDEIHLATGFGISATQKVDKTDQPNVKDWEGCPLLVLVTISQVS